MTIVPNKFSLFSVSKTVNANNASNTTSAWNSEEGLKLLLESAPMAMLMVGYEGRILFVNVKAVEMFGYSRQELVDQKVEMLIPDRFRHNHVQHRENYVEEPHSRPMGIGLELSAKRKDGTEFPIEVGLSTVNLKDEFVTIATVYDVTIRKQAEAELERRVEERTHELERRRQVSDGLRDILDPRLRR